MVANRSGVSIRNAYLLEDFKLPSDGRRWAQRLTLPLGTGLVSVEMWSDWDSVCTNSRLELSEDEGNGGPHTEIALSLLEERVATASDGGFSKKQAVRVVREYLHALATGEVPPRVQNAVAERQASRPTVAPDTTFDYRLHLTLSFEEERQVWLDAIPELTRLFASIPRRKGELEVFFGAVPDCPGAVVLTARVLDKAEGGPRWWWCDSECLQTTRSDLGQRVAAARAHIKGLKKSRAAVARPRPSRSQHGDNVVPFGWYKHLFAEEGL